jgi:type IV fimbrial biogenesis protein FimT
MHRSSKASGFTVVELLTVIGIIAIISAIAVPGVMSWLPSYRLRAAAQDWWAIFRRRKWRRLNVTGFAQ